jgi:pyrroline-5-carboxylate reductase
MLAQTVGFIGAGQMARALARGLVEAGVVKAEQITGADVAEAAVDQFVREIPGARRAANNAAVAEKADVIILAVKPQQLESATAALASATNDKLVISVLAGVRLSKLAAVMPKARLVRVMPNTPALVGLSASAYSLGPHATAADDQLVAALLGAVGRAYRVDEKLLDAVTGLSGSGPAFVYVAIEALADGGVRMGLPREMLKDRVASPGGTTIAGLQALENGGLRAALISAVEAATRRSIELGAG